ncbi:unnamed protein product [Amoebophrya sp. A120]|nr:unnamed protein product [Amoebophrya sp. A120]|eukprot:GSA120T00021596001.1
MMQALYVGALEVRAQLRHRLMAPMYASFQAASTLSPSPGKSPSWSSGSSAPQAGQDHLHASSRGTASSTSLQNKIPNLDEFLAGARQAFIHVNTNLVQLQGGEIATLEPCFTPSFWEQIKHVGDHLDQDRAEHGESYRLQFKQVTPYLNEVIYNEEEKKLFVEVEYFSRYSFQFEGPDSADETRFNTVLFEMELSDNPTDGNAEGPAFRIARSE